MDDGETPPPPAAKRRKAPYMPHELVSEILARLPAESLLRFSRVCKAWRATIAGDASFHRAHLRFQKPCLLISPHTQDEYHLRRDRPLVPVDKVGLYRWEAHQQGATASLVHACTDLSSDDPMHWFAHCDGLVLLPAEASVHVLNPATRRTLTLPWSPGADPPRHDHPYPYANHHQAFGLGHDPRSDKYKVARFFYRSVYSCATGGGYHHTTGMEVFTIGADRHWRETTMQPPYPVLVRRTATFFMGSLLWTIDERYLQDNGGAPGFLRFSLEDETFGVMPPPPCQPRLEYATSSLAELHGELCLACVGADDDKSLQLWMCNNVNKSQWDRRYTIIVSTFNPQYFYPVAAFDGEILFKHWPCSTRRYDLRTKAFQEVSMFDLKYYNPRTCTYISRGFAYFDVIHYVPSLIPI